jgi:hypothetical protein
MEPVVLTTYVTAWGHLPHLIIDARLVTAISENNDQLPTEIELSDNDALELLHMHRFPHR